MRVVGLQGARQGSDAVVRRRAGVGERADHDGGARGRRRSAAVVERPVRAAQELQRVVGQRAVGVLELQQRAGHLEAARDGGVVAGLRARLQQVRLAEVEQRLAVVRPQGHGSLGRRDRAIVVAAQERHAGEAVVRAGVVRVELQDSGEVAQRLVEVGFCRGRPVEVLQALGELLLGVAELGQRQRVELVMGRRLGPVGGRFGQQVGGGAVVLRGDLLVRPALVGDREAAVGDPGQRRVGHRRQQGSLGAGVVGATGSGHAEQVERGRGGRLSRLLQGALDLREGARGALAVVQQRQPEGEAATGGLGAHRLLDPLQDLADVAGVVADALEVAEDLRERLVQLQDAVADRVEAPLSPLEQGAIIGELGQEGCDLVGVALARGVELVPVRGDEATDDGDQPQQLAHAEVDGLALLEGLDDGEQPPPHLLPFDRHRHPPADLDGRDPQAGACAPRS